MKVFLLEDDDAIGMGLKYSLEKEGYSACLYKSKADALNAWKTGEYDLDGNYNDESDASSDSDDGDDGPKFGESERHERTADGKISISGRDLFKD